MPQTFRLKPEGVGNRVRKTTLFRALFAVVVVGAVTVWLSHADSAKEGVIIAVVLLAVMGLALWRQMGPARRTYESFEVLLSENEIVRRLANWPDLVLSRESVAKITQFPNGDIFIRGRSLSQVIAVPRDLENWDEFYSAILAWHAIEQRRRRFLPFVNTAVSLLMVALFVAAFASDKRWVVIPCGTVDGTGLIVCMILIWLNPQVDERIRRGLWIMAFPLASIAFRVLQVLRS